GPHVMYDGLLSLPNIEIALEPSCLMNHFAGISCFAQGHRIIFLDTNDVHRRRRFALAHEFQHSDHGLRDRYYTGWKRSPASSSARMSSARGTRVGRRNKSRGEASSPTAWRCSPTKRMLNCVQSTN